MNEVIEWKRAESELPDADTTVLIIVAGDAEIYFGFYDGIRWRDADNFSCDVIYWADVPAGPAQ